MRSKHRVGIAVFQRCIGTKIDPAPELGGPMNDRQQLIQVVVPNNSIEPNAIDTGRKKPRNRGKNLIRKPWYTTLNVMPPVEKIQRDVELIDPSIPQRLRALHR